MGRGIRAFPLGVAGALALVVILGTVDAGTEPPERLSIRAHAGVEGQPLPHLDVSVTDPGEVRVGERASHELTIQAREQAALGDPRITERVAAEDGDGELLVGSYTVRWRELSGLVVSETTADDRRLVAAPGAPVVEEVTLFTGVADVRVSEGRYVVRVPLDVATAGVEPAVLVLTYDVEAASS